YYMNTYGIHSIHGRAPTFATGLKLARPELNIWMVTGDGDALSIGGNHFLHIIRRNVDVKSLLFNNRIYGLTKGQYSPTSEQGKPLVFGKTSEQGIRLHALKPEVVDLANVPKDDLLVHDEKGPSSLAFLLSRMRQPDFPEPLGVFREVEQERYVNIVRKQIDAAKEKHGEGNLQELLTGSETWTVS